MISRIQEEKIKEVIMRRSEGNKDKCDVIVDEIKEIINRKDKINCECCGCLINKDSYECPFCEHEVSNELI